MAIISKQKKIIGIDKQAVRVAFLVFSFVKLNLSRWSIYVSIVLEHMIKNKLATLVGMNFVRYVVVGAVSFVGDYATFITFYYVLHTGTAIAAPAGLVAGFILNFALNKLWSFQNKDTAPKQVAKQVVQYVFLVGINTVFTYYFVETLRTADIIAPKFSKVLASVLIVAWNYIIYKKIIFNSREKIAPPSDKAA